MMKRITVELCGVAPLLLHSNVGVNPMHPLTIAKKKISGKKKKTEEDILAMLDIDWELGLYWDDHIGVVIPANVVEAMLREAAKKIKKGKDVVSSLYVFPDMIPLHYQGPTAKEELKADMRFRDVRPGRIGLSTILICRPRFDNWSIECDVEYDTAIFDDETIQQIFTIAGTYIGLCDYRPRYGKFGVIYK